MSQPLSHARILLVEDEPLVGMAAEAALASSGAEVLWTRTDRGAYDLLDAAGARFDLLIADINLREGTTGFDVARHARRLDPDLPVIYVSGESPGALHPYGIPGPPWLYKPFSDAELVSAAVRLIRAAPKIDCPMPRPA